MKKVLFILAVLSCKGPEGPVGPQGPAGSNGANGAQGPQGPAGAPGTAAKARYYDFNLKFLENAPGTTTNYEIKNYNFATEMPIVYAISGSLVKQLPVVNQGLTSIEGDFNVVDMVCTSTNSTTGLLFFADWNYEDNPASTYKFRVVLIPIQDGGRLDAESIKKMPYEEVCKRYNLVKGN